MESRKTKSRKNKPSAFVLFCKDTRKLICNACPSMNPHDVSSLLSELWKSLPSQQKQHYKELESQFIEIQPFNDYPQEKIIQQTEKMILPSIQTFFPNSLEIEQKNDSIVNDFINRFQLTENLNI